MKKKGIFCLIGIFMIMSGGLIVNHLGDRQGRDIIGPPEGYEAPVSKVKKLKIRGSVSKYYDDNIDLVAFGPGSGWLKLKTRDGISPTLSFNGVSQRDIQIFNQFSQNAGLPIRAEFSDNTLRLSTVGDDADSIHIADITEEKLGADSIMSAGLYKVEKPPRLAIRKDRSGKVFLVAIDKQKSAPDQIPEEEDIFIVKKGKGLK